MPRRKRRPPRFSFQPGNPLPEVLFLPGKSRFPIRFAQSVQGSSVLSHEFGESEFCVFQGAISVPRPALVIDGQLLAGVDRILAMVDHFLPDFGGALVFPVAFGQQRQLSLCFEADVGG